MSLSGGAPAPDARLLERLRARPPERIAVVQTAFLGDTVFSSTLVNGLAARFPGARLTFVATPRGRDAALAMASAPDVLVYDKRGKDRGLAGFQRITRELRERACTLAVLPHRSIRSALLAWRAAIPERLGFADAPGRFLYTARAEARADGPFLEREAALLAALDARPGPMELRPTDLDRAAAESRLRKLGAAGSARLVAFALGSEWSTKIWPTAQTAELAQRLAARDLVPLLLGGPREKPIAAEILRACPRALDTTGNPIGEALALIARSVLCIGGDSGLAHAARALSVPTLLLFGPTDPKLHQLGKRERALWLHLDCSPCGAHGARRCPLGHHRCLRDLSAAAVEESALELLAMGPDRVR